MRSLKTSGGLTHGRGMTDLQRSVWLLSTPACAEISQAMQEITGILYEASEQHKETTQARLEKDFNDAATIMRYLLARNPFSHQNELRNIHTGEIADETVSVDNAKEIGQNIISSMAGKIVTKYVFKKKDKAVTMKSGSTVQIDKDVVPVDPQLLFQCLIASIQIQGSDCDVSAAFSYELCTFPPALFGTDGLLQEAHKPQIVDALSKHIIPSEVKVSDHLQYVIDGGYCIKSFGVKVKRMMKYVSTISLMSLSIMAKVQ